jgi:peptide/nickel transport system permease protein
LAAVAERIEGHLAEPAGYWAQCARRLFASGWAIFGLGLVLVILALAAIGPIVYSVDPNFQTSAGLTADGNPLGPSRSFPLGTDTLGRDVLARILHGARVSLEVSFLSNALAAAVGLLVGGFAGTSHGLTRNLLMRAVDVVLSFPSLLLAMVFLALAQPSIVTVAAIIGIGWGAYLARIVYGIVASLAGRDMTASAIAIGASRWRVLWRHLLPHTLPAVIVYVTLGIGVAIQAEAVFGYIGIGIQPPEASWGNMIAGAQGYIVSDPWLILVPALAIVSATLGFAILGDGLRQALDPTMDRGRLLPGRR